MVRAESDSTVAGIGFVLGDGLIGFDADECLDGNRMPTNDFARDVLSLNTYTEVSPSGTGVKAIVRGTIRENHNLRAKDGLPKREVYDGRQSCARFFTITGERYGSATEIRADIQEQLDRVYDKHFGAYEKAPKVLRRAQTSRPKKTTTMLRSGCRMARFSICCAKQGTGRTLSGYSSESGMIMIRSRRRTLRLSPCSDSTAATFLR